MNVFQPFSQTRIPVVLSVAAFCSRLGDSALVTAALVSAALLGAPLGAQALPDTVSSTLLRASHPWLSDGGRFVDVQRVVRDARANDSVGDLRWTAGTGAPTSVARAVLAHFAQDVESSRAELADIAILDSVAARFETRWASAPERGLFDIGMDIAIARHAFVHRQGRIDPSRVHAEWSLAAAELDLTAVRTSLSAGTSPTDVFSALEPQTRSYAMLVAALAEVRRQESDTSEQLPAARARPLSVGGRYSEAALRATAWEGRFLVIGFAAGDIPKIPLNLTLLKGCDIRGVFWGAFAMRETARHLANVAELMQWFKDGKIKPLVSATYSFEDVAKALNDIATRRATGKIVLLPPAH